MMNINPNIDEIRKYRKQVEAQIMAIFIEFKKKTGLNVLRCDICYITYTSFGINDERIITGVELSIERI